MRTLKALGGLTVVACLAAGLLGVMASAAVAAGGIKVCVPSAEGQGIQTPIRGACKLGYTLTELGAEGKEGKEGKQGKEGANGATGAAGPEGTFAGLTSAEKETLLAILPDVKYQAEGIQGKPTIQFSGVNVQVLSGAGKEETLNGEGNLVVGYSFDAAQFPGGSNNLEVGSPTNAFTNSYGALLAGSSNEANGPDNVLFGFDNVASGMNATVTGGSKNQAEGELDSIGGGTANVTTGTGSSVGGGYGNTASGAYSSISGGEGNTASGIYSSILGGQDVLLSTQFGVSP